MAEVFAHDEIAELATFLPDFTATACVWRPESDAAWDGFIGTPVDALARDLAETGELPDVFVCAPPPMVDAVEQLLARRRGFPGFDSEAGSRRIRPLRYGSCLRSKRSSCRG